VGTLLAAVQWQLQGLSAAHSTLWGTLRDSIATSDEATDMAPAAGLQTGGDGI
jgi:hypothetical protein